MASATRPVILAVDDEPGVLESFRLILENDYDIVDALDGRTALAVLESRPVDLVLLDLMLPDIHGLALLEKIRGNGLDVPVLVVTALDRAGTALQAIRLGAFDYVTKPFDEEELVRLVECGLEHRELGRRRASVLPPPAAGVLVASRDLGLKATLAAVMGSRCWVSTVSTLSAALDALRDAGCHLVIVHADTESAGAGIDAIRRHQAVAVLLLIGDLGFPGKERHPPGSAIEVHLPAPVDFEHLFGDIAVLLSVTPGAPSWTAPPPRIARVVSHVAAGYPSVTVEDLAAFAGLSSAHLSREFHSAVGLPAKRFISRVRIEAAKILLRETDEKLGAIARRVGLYDGPHLNRTFRQFGAGTPGSYR
jgi:CheY-like chemotaxis protein